MFALPLINVHRVKRWFSQLIRPEEGINDDFTLNTTNSACAVCNEAPIIPQKTQCHHIFCYYCLKVYFKSNKVLTIVNFFLLSYVAGQFSC